MIPPPPLLSPPGAQVLLWHLHHTTRYASTAAELAQDGDADLGTALNRQLNKQLDEHAGVRRAGGAAMPRASLPRARAASSCDAIGAAGGDGASLEMPKAQPHANLGSGGVRVVGSAAGEDDLALHSGELLPSRFYTEALID